MIEWPDESAMNDEGREGLSLFRETSAAAELAASPRRYRVAAWPWTRERPVRLVLESDTHEDVVFSLDDDGVWTLAPAAIGFHMRSNEALERDAAAEIPWASEVRAPIE